MDKRVIKTKEKIITAFLKLLEKKKLEQISVQAICQTAKVNRGTFYLHYQDKYQLLEDLENETLADIMFLKDEIINQFNQGKLPFYDKELMYKILLNFYTKVNNNAMFIKTILSINGDLNFQYRLQKDLMQIIRYNLTNPEYKIKSKIPINYLAAMIVEMQLGIIKEWLNNNNDETPEQLAVMAAGIFSIMGKNFLEMQMDRK